MANTTFLVNSPETIKRWSNALAVETTRKQYFNKFIGKGQDSIIMLLEDLSRGKGDNVKFSLRMKLANYGVEGDATLEGDAVGDEGLTFFTDSLGIDQLRKATTINGKMTEQRVAHNLRVQSKNGISDWFAETIDSMIFCYLSGARGVNVNTLTSTWAGTAGNALQAPDAAHLVYGGNATGKADLDSGDIMTLTTVNKLVVKSKILTPKMNPVMINGQRKFVLVMNPLQAFSLRDNTSTNQWVDIQKNAGERGAKNPLYLDALGEYSGVILHEHENVVTFDDYGATTDLTAARALFMGAQAGVMAYGMDAGSVGRFNWNEDDTIDAGNKTRFAGAAILGVKKSVFDSKDFGVISADTYVPVV